MTKFVEPVLLVNRLYYDTEYLEDDSLSYEGPKEKRSYYRAKKRIYLKDVQSIEEYKYTNFQHFTNSPITRVYTNNDYFLAEIAFDVLADMLDQYDKNKIIKIAN